LLTHVKKSEKAVTAPFEYNKRVAELRFANLLILDAVYNNPSYAEHKNPDFNFKKHWDDIEFLPRAREIQEILKIDNLGKLVNLCDSVLKESYKKTELYDLFDSRKINHLMNYCGADVFDKNEHFDLLGPLKHVFEETQRVHEFIKVCEDPRDNVEKHQVLGNLMNASHFSMSNRFGAGCPELENLSSICRDAGAYGARTTGAGWGGSIVVACSPEKVDDIIEACKVKYFIPNYDNPKLTIAKMCPNKEDFSKVLFSTKPGCGVRWIEI